MAGRFVSRLAAFPLAVGMYGHTLEANSPAGDGFSREHAGQLVNDGPMLVLEL
jgi:hypothetical protein